MIFSQRPHRLNAFSHWNLRGECNMFGCDVQVLTNVNSSGVTLDSVRGSVALSVDPTAEDTKAHKALHELLASAIKSPAAAIATLNSSLKGKYAYHSLLYYLFTSACA